MPLGTIKFYDSKRGYGFIIPHHGGKEIFVHVSNIPKSLKQDGIVVLQGKETVEYEVIHTEKGLSAVNLQLVD